MKYRYTGATRVKDGDSRFLPIWSIELLRKIRLRIDHGINIFSISLIINNVTIFNFTNDLLFFISNRRSFETVAILYKRPLLRDFKMQDA